MDGKNNGIDFFRFFNGEASEKESEELLKWLDKKKENRLFYFNLKRIWLESHQSDEEVTNRNWDRLRFRIFNPKSSDNYLKKKKRVINWKYVSIAAGVSLLIVSAFFIGDKLQFQSNNLSQINQISVPYGSRTNICLPDGTKVWLNSGSELTYNLKNWYKTREVSLTGEAFFDVKKHKFSSFTVKTSNINIYVLGTQFNVKSYPEEEIVETVLIKGEVKVLAQKRNKSFAPITLLPNQKLTYIKNTKNVELKAMEEENVTLENEKIAKITKKQFTITNVSDPEVDISWKEEKLIIKSEKLETIAPKLERYYDVEIIFEDDSIKQFRFTGTLDKLLIEEVMRAIASTSPINFKINKNKIALSLSKN